MQKETKIKLFKVATPVVFILVFLGINYYWKTVCLDGGCSYNLMDKVLDPIYYGAISLATFFSFFLLLPVRYLISWLKYFFSWLFPVGVLLVVSNLSSSGGSLPIFAKETIMIYSIFAAAVTLIFIGIKYYLEHSKH